LGEDEPKGGRAVGAPRYPGWVRASIGLLAAVVLAGCSALGANNGTPKATTPIGRIASRPNIVFILTDDLSSNLVPYMPHVRALARRGASFTNYFVTDSLCCPSRASIFTGQYPHDTGVFTNGGLDGGFWTFDRHRDPNRTYAVALQRAGYHTALMGKYLNGYKPGLQFQLLRPWVPEGWDEWDVAGNGYGEYGYSLNQNHRIVRYGGKPSAYLTNVLARLAKKYVSEEALSDNGSPTPFALEIATFAPHAPYIAAPRDRKRFRRARVPRTPAFGHRDELNNPRWLDAPPLNPAAIASIDRDFRRRVRSVQAVDRMLAALEHEVRVDGLASSTYFVFSSDNGYHMGEHNLRPGKMTAFDTDIHVPLVIAGPGIRPGMRIDALAENIDLAPTFEELAGRTPAPSVDGRSLVPLLEGHVPADWRRAVLVEHHGPDVDPSDPDFPLPESGNPPSYEAIRLAHSVYVEYIDGEHEYYDVAADPFELRNAYVDLPPARRLALHRDVARLAHCHGAVSCHRADQLLPSSKPRNTPTTLRPSTSRS
jgi:arylsulfatase A-like enzyme